MASLNRARRTTQGSVLRPFALLVVVSLLLLGLRNTDAVRGSSTFLTQLLVPVQRVLADLGAAGDRITSAITQIDRLRDSPLIRSLIGARVPAGSVVAPMKHTDELYMSNYNKDHGGDQGLFDRHYDGNLRFLSSSVVVRALIYLQSDATYKVVFGDSRVEKAFATYEFGLMDFHRELHWVEGHYNPADRQRILLKCNYLVTRRNAALLGRAALAANTGVFYVVKSAMEYSKSPRTPPQVAVGLLCNLFRRLNNMHPLIPLALIAAVIGALGWATGWAILRLLA